MPVNLNLSLLNKIALNQTASELFFVGEVDFGRLPESLFDAKLIEAFKANTNLNAIILQHPVSYRLADKIILALKHIKPPIELGLSGLDFATCVQVMNGLPGLKNIYTLQLINLSLVSCGAVMDRLPNSPQIGALEVQGFSLETTQRFTQALIKLEGIRGLRLYNLKPNIVDELMKVLPKTRIRLLRVTQPSSTTVDIVQRELPNSKKMYAFDLVRITTENCISLIDAISRSKKIDVLGLTELSPTACAEVMNRLPAKIYLLLAIQLTLDACEVVIEKLRSKPNVTEVRLISLTPEVEVLMLSGLESLGFIASKNDSGIFIRSGVTVTSTLPIPKSSGVKRTADNAAIADTSTSKAARQAVQQPASSGMAQNIIASSAIFQQPTQALGPDEGGFSGSKQAYKSPTLSSPELFGSPKPAQEVIELSDENSRPVSPEVW